MKTAQKILAEIAKANEIRLWQRAAPPNPNAVALGRLGGAKKSERKASASRENGKKGGRPRTRKDRGKQGRNQ